MKLLKSQSISVGLAMFSMFFGAGNVIFPLALGRYAQDQNGFAILGLILTAAVIPIAGVIAMILFDGNYRRFFGRLGKTTGFVVALTVISLLGPLGSTPRCISLAYTTFKSSFLPLSSVFFSLFACLIIFFCTIKRTRILPILGLWLTPLLLASLVAIIVIGTLTHHETVQTDASTLHMFIYGIVEGYNTMDLLAAFFFSSTLLHLLRLHKQSSQSNTVRVALQASVIATILLSLIYIGFSYLAAFHATTLFEHGKDELLSAITLKISGPYAGFLVCTAIGLACLTTAIALITAFVDFLQSEVFKQRTPYWVILACSLIVTFFVSIFDFTEISSFLGPILQILYPGLIVLTFLNIAYRLINFRPVKTPVFTVFFLSLIFYFIN